MTEKEKKAIEYLENLHPMIWWQLPDRKGKLKRDMPLENAIYTALNLIQKYQAEINEIRTYILAQGVDDKLKTATQIQLENEHNRLHLLEIERYKKIIKRQEKEIEKKDKIIDLMAEYIGQDIKCIRPEIECNKMTHDCRECVKQYFKKKV